MIDDRDKDDISRRIRLVSLVDSMLELQRQHVAARSHYEKNIVQRQIVANDRQIDRLVYELYGLTQDEIATVESSK